MSWGARYRLILNDAQLRTLTGVVKAEVENSLSRAEMLAKAKRLKDLAGMSKQAVELQDLFKAIQRIERVDP